MLAEMKNILEKNKVNNPNFMKFLSQYLNPHDRAHFSKTEIHANIQSFAIKGLYKYLCTQFPLFFSMFWDVSVEYNYCSGYNSKVNLQKALKQKLKQADKIRSKIP
jgi:hypothetical protein